MALVLSAELPFVRSVAGREANLPVRVGSGLGNSSSMVVLCAELLDKLRERNSCTEKTARTLTGIGSSLNPRPTIEPSICIA